MRPIPSMLVIAASLPVLAAQIPCVTPEDAKAAAEAETLGEAVTARHISLNRAGFGGWEVLVHMPGKEQGWRVVINWDDGKVLGKEAIPNPPSKVP